MRFLSVVLIALLSAPAFGQYYLIECDTQNPTKQYVIDSVFSGNTPYLKAKIYENGTAVNLTSWAMQFCYSYGQYDTNGMVVINGVVSNTNTVSFLGATNVFFKAFDKYYFSIKGTHTAGYVKTFATGRMIQRYDPATATNLTTLMGQLNMNWWTNNVGAQVESNRVAIATLVTGKVDLVTYLAYTAAQSSSNDGFNIRIASNETARTAQVITNAGFDVRIVAVETGKMALAEQAATNAYFQGLHTAQGNSNTYFQGLFEAQANSNAYFQAFKTAQGNSNTYFQGLHTAQANTNTGLQNQLTVLNTGKTDQATYLAGLVTQAATNAGLQDQLAVLSTGKTDQATYLAGLVTQAATNAGLQDQLAVLSTGKTDEVTYLAHVSAQANSNADYESRIGIMETGKTAQATYLAHVAAQAATNAEFETRIQQGEDAYGWGDHALAGYLSGATNIFASITAGDRTKLGTNIAGLTAATYTGALTSVAYTGLTVLAVGRTYVWGFNKVNAYGTSTLSIAEHTLTRTASGAASNFFTYTGTDSNLVLTLYGDGSSKSDVTNVHVRLVTNGIFNVASDFRVGDGMYLGGVRRTTWPLDTNAIWGNITGAITDQADLTNALGQKADAAAIPVVGITAGTFYDGAQGDAVSNAVAGLTNDVAVLQTNTATKAQGALADTALQVETDPVWAGWLSTNGTPLTAADVAPIGLLASNALTSADVAPIGLLASNALTQTDGAALGLVASNALTAADVAPIGLLASNALTQADGAALGLVASNALTSADVAPIGLLASNALTQTDGAALGLVASNALTSADVAPIGLLASNALTQTDGAALGLVASNALTSADVAPIGLLASNALTSAGVAPIGLLASNALTQADGAALGLVASNALTAADVAPIGLLASNALTQTDGAALGLVASNALTAADVAPIGLLASNALTQTDGAALGLVASNALTAADVAPIGLLASNALTQTDGAALGLVASNALPAADVAPIGLLASNALTSAGVAPIGLLASNALTQTDGAALGLLGTNALPKAGGTMTGPITNEHGYYGDGGGLTNLTSDPSAWSGYPATNMITWYEDDISDDTNYLVISGSSSPEVAGLYHWEEQGEFWAYRSAFGYVAPQEDLETNIVFWYLVSGSSEFRNYSADPTAGGYDAYNNATGTLLAAYGSATNALTWRAGYDVTTNRWVISRNGANIQEWFYSYPAYDVVYTTIKGGLRVDSSVKVGGGIEVDASIHTPALKLNGVYRTTWPSEYSDTAIRADLSAVSNQAAAGSNLAYALSLNLDTVSNWAVAGSNLAFDVAGNLSVVSNLAVAASNLAAAGGADLTSLSNNLSAVSNLAYDVSVNLDTVSNWAVAGSNLAYDVSVNLDAVSNWAVAGSNLAFDVAGNLSVVSNLAVAASNLAAAGGADLTSLSNNLSAVSNLAALALPTTGGAVTGNVTLAGGNLTASTLTLTNGPAAGSVWVVTNANGSGQLRVLAKMVMRPYGAPVYSGIYATNKWGEVAASVGGLTGTVNGIKVHRAGWYQCNMLLNITGLTNQNQFMRAQLTRNNFRLHYQYGPISATPNQYTISCNQSVVHPFYAGDVIGVQYYLYLSSEGQTNGATYGGYLSVHELP